MNRLWAKYFLRETSKVLFLFLCCFYFLYVLIDYASHTGRFAQGHHTICWSVLAKYYLSLLATHLDILLPLGILLAVIKTLYQINVRHELLALQVGCIPLKQLMRPFLLIGLGGTLFLYANEQIFLPAATHTLQKLDQSYRLEKNKKSQEPMVHALHLHDGSTLLYHSYHPERQFFSDVYWVRSHDDLFHLQYLYPYAEITIGQFLEHFVRNEEGHLVVQERFETKSLSSLHFDPESLRGAIAPLRELSLLELWQSRPKSKTILNEEQSQCLASLYGKLTLPWLALFAVWGPLPTCIRYRKEIPIFLIYLVNIFGLITCYMLLDMGKILAERQVLSPFWAIWPFFLGVSMLLGYRYHVSTK